MACGVSFWLAWDTACTQTSGILSGANREIPIFMGAGRHADADEIERSVFGSTLLVAGFLALAVAIVAAWTSVSPLVAVLAAAAIGLQQLYLLGQLLLRARLRFNAASSQQFALAFLFPLVALPLLSRLGVLALVVGQATALRCRGGDCVLGWRRDLRPMLSPAVTRSLVRVGFPIMTGGIPVFALLTTGDRWFVWLLGSTSLGTYTLASVLSSGMLLVSQVVAQQFYPRMAMRYGHQGGATGLMGMALQQGGSVIVLVAPIALVVGLAGPWAISTWLPKYEVSIPALLILTVAYVVLLSGTGFWNLLIVAGRADLYVACQVIAVATEVLLSVLLVRLGLGIAGVALGDAVAFCALTALGAAISVRLTR